MKIKKLPQSVKDVDWGALSVGLSGGAVAIAVFKAGKEPFQGSPAGLGYASVALALIFLILFFSQIFLTPREEQKITATHVAVAGIASAFSALAWAIL